MSGHSKWSQIKHKKAVSDSEKGKVFTRHAKLITIAAREGGGNPEMNSSLRIAIDRAKNDNMPTSNIERAIKKGTGEEKNTKQMFSVRYEGHGPGNVAILIEAFTDNKNRTATNVRTAFTKNGGILGESGSVAWIFEQFGILKISCKESEVEDIELTAIDLGVMDIFYESSILKIFTDPKKLMEIKEKLQNLHFTIQESEILFLPKRESIVDDYETAKKFLKLIETLEEDDDIERVSTNVSFSKEILKMLEE